MTRVENWLPPGKQAGVVLTIDDVHPAPSAASALRHLRGLQENHPQLRVTFFTTPDWRSIAPFPQRRLVSRLPVLRDFVWSVPVLPAGTRSVDRHPDFCTVITEWDRAEVALHGLHHVRRGMNPIVEFERRSERECRALLTRALEIFANANVPCVPGLCPPGWAAPPQLTRAMASLGMRFLASARDLSTPVSAHAESRGSGLQGVSLIFPQWIADRLMHFTTNFQANCSLDRARAVVDHGGLLAIKAHLLPGAGAYRALDGLTADYCEFLHRTLSALEDRYGDALWWTSMGEIACA